MAGKWEHVHEFEYDRVEDCKDQKRILNAQAASIVVHPKVGALKKAH